MKNGKLPAASVLDPQAIQDVTNDVLNTHIIVFAKQPDGRITVWFTPKDGKIEISAMMPTLPEALSVALEMWQGTKACIEMIPIELEAA